jgi:hypothetical protein
MSELRAKNVRLADIDLDDLSFSAGDPNPDEGLNESVRLTSVVNPPLLIESEKGAAMYTVVCGHRRLRAARDAGVSEIAASVLEGTRSEAVILAAADHSSNERLSAADMARLVTLAAESGMSEDDIRTRLLPVFGLKPSRKLLDSLLFLAGLRETPGAGTVSLSALPYLMRLGRDAAEEAIRLFSMLRPGTNYQKEILSLAEEIALREGVPASEVLSEGAKEVPEDAPRARKIERLRNSLFERRYPRLSAHEEEFGRAVERTGTAPAVAWRHAAAFEAPRLTAEISFESKEELEDAVKRLEGSLKDGSMDELIDVCRCEVKIPADQSDKIRGVRAQEDSDA